jgi:hypothetical protein
MDASLSPRDLALLVVLGTAGRAPAPLEDIVAAAKSLAPRDWQPTRETIGGAVARALGEGSLRLSGTGLETVVTTSPHGRSRLADLLRQPIPRWTGGFARACMSAKLSFLDALAQPERGDRAEDLALLYRDAIETLARLASLPGPLAGPAASVLRHERMRMDCELVWLDAMTLRHLPQEAAE